MIPYCIYMELKANSKIYKNFLLDKNFICPQIYIQIYIKKYTQYSLMKFRESKSKQLKNVKS
jgi:hypothetical protein